MINRRKYSIANFKMNKTNSDVENYLNALYKLGPVSSDISKHRIVICPSFTSLLIDNPAAKLTITKNFFAFGAQNISSYENGAYTGEISALMITRIDTYHKSLVKYVILGHSERREHFKETNQEINKKVVIALKYNLKPILCIGETLEERKNNQVETILKKQLSKCLQNVKSNIIVAYEPVWAIGTGETATSEIITKTHQMIRNILNDIGFDGQKISILYGGSVNRNNAKELIALDDVDGFLIGGASLDAQHFHDICKFIEES